MSAVQPVVRVALRRARPGCAPAYEALVRSMFADAKCFPGFLGAELIPPRHEDEEYRVVFKFATEADLARWDTSEQRTAWLERLRPLADGEPEFHLLSGMEAWFVPPPVAVTTPPSRHKMAFVTWLGIFPTVSFFLGVVAPLLGDLPFLLRVGLLTGLVVITMTYVVMPRLVRVMKPWLHGANG